MDEIDFSEELPKNKNKQKVLVILLSVIAALIMGGGIYYNNWNSKLDELKIIIEAEELIKAEDIYNSLITSPIKLASIDEFYPKIQRLKLKYELLEVGSYFSEYYKPYNGKEYSLSELDSISLTVKRIKEIEAKFSSILTPRSRLIIDLEKLYGLNKLVLNKSSFFISSFFEEFIGNYSIYLNDSERKKLWFERDSSTKEVENQTIDVLESLSRNAEAMKESGIWMDEENKNLRDAFYLMQFYFNPNISNTRKLLGQEIGSLIGNNTAFITGSMVKDLDVATFKKVLYRLMGSDHSQAQLTLDNSQEVAKEVFKILEAYLSYCYDCPYDEKLALYYFNSAGIVHNFRFSGLASYNNLKLKTDPLDIFLVFEKFIQKAKENKAGGWFSLMIYKYAIFLHQTEQFNELAKLSNNLENLVEEVGLSFSSLNDKGVHYINPLMVVYLLDSNYRWDKKDYEAVDSLYEKINRRISLTSRSDNDYIEYLDYSPSLILRNMWAVKVNLDQQDACSFLRKASDLNPKEFYEEYLKNCLSK